MIALFPQDGSLCCSYNLHCNDNAVAVGFDGITVPSAPTQQHKLISTTKISTDPGQYSSAYSLGDGASVDQKKQEPAEGVTMAAGG